MIRTMSAILGCSFLLLACGEVDEEETGSATNSALFGLHVPNYALRVSEDKAGEPVCFEVNAWQNNSLLDFAGAEVYRTTTKTPFLYLPAKASSSGKEFVGTGPICLGEDGDLYLSVKEYVPPPNIVPGLHSGGNIGSAVKTVGPERWFHVGEFHNVPAKMKWPDNFDMKQVPLTDDFKCEFRQIETQGYEDTIDSPNYWTFVFTSERKVKELSAPPKLATFK